MGYKSKAARTFLVFLALTLLATTASAAISVSILSVEALPGEETTAEIVAHNVTNLTQFGIVLDYDPAVVNATGAANNPNFPDEFMLGYSLHDFSHASEGYVLLGSNPITAIPQSGTDVLLTTVTLKAVGSSGTSALGLTIAALRDDAGDVSAEVINGTFTIREVTVSIRSVEALPGEETTAEIVAHNVTNLTQFGIVLDYDPAVVNATGAANNPNFPDEFMLGYSLHDFSHASEGYVLLGSNPITAIPQSGTDVLLTTVTLKAVGSSGTSALGLTIAALRDDAGDVSATVINGTFTIREVTVSIRSVEALPGEETTAEIVAHNVTNLTQFGIVLDYDPAVVNATGAANNPNFPDEFMLGYSLHDFSHASEGYVLLGSNPITAIPQSGTDVLLTTVTLKAVGSSGTSALGLTIAALRDDAGDVSATVINGTFTITDEAETTGDIVINEIMYDPDGYDTWYEWIELHNNDTEEINVDGWILNGMLGGSNTILSGTMNAGSYLLIARNVTAFQERYDVTCPIIKGNWSALGNTGDTINLWDSTPTLIDTVAYTDIASVNHTAERNATGGWAASLDDGGTPCAENG